MTSQNGPPVMNLPVPPPVAPMLAKPIKALPPRFDATGMVTPIASPVFSKMKM